MKPYNNDHTKHNDTQYKKISNNIALLKRAKLFVPQNTLITVQCTDVTPFLLLLDNLE